MNAMELEAGPELDAAVAKIVGLDVEIIGGKAMCTFGEYEYWLNPEGGMTCEGFMGKHFAPSTDLNAAFEAAEKADVFGMWELSNGTYGWQLIDGQNCRTLTDGHATPAVAICHAILKLKNKQ